MADFGENLKKARTEKGITQQTLADHLFVTRQAVSWWEGGSRYPDLMTAKKIATILSTLFFGTQILSALVGLFSIPTGYGKVIVIGVAIIYLAILCLCAGYFRKNNKRNPLPLYIVCVFYEIAEIIKFVQRIGWADFSSEYNYYFLSTLITSLADMLFIGLLCYMAYILNCKRKRAVS